MYNTIETIRSKRDAIQQVANQMTYNPNKKIFVSQLCSMLQVQGIRVYRVNDIYIELAGGGCYQLINRKARRTYTIQVI